ncbi:TIGR04222 domain-containing membrane protein [Streptomyces sp. NPDC096032]|uniref:TIGR04222 domain-containing membrane protein n=1 Tax=Streptomyces sp. NPDC096032 TaxID=3366070 RepID=UPI0037F1812E
MDRTPSIPPDACAVALLRGGDRAALTVAVLGLHLRGVVEAGRPGTLRRAGGPAAAGPFRHPLEKAVRTGLYRPAGPRELPGRAVVRRALARMRAELRAAGLLRSLPPGPTRAARRELAALRALHPLPDGPGGLSHDQVLLTVALHGERALTVLVPVFARDSGLTGRGALADEGLFPFGRGSGLRGIAGDGGLPGRHDDSHGPGTDAPTHGTGHGHGADFGGHGGGHDHGAGCGSGGYG